MEFEFDPTKSAANLAKHGIDFEEAQALWDDAAMVWGPVHHPVEDRFMALGQIRDHVCAVVYTVRKGRIRLISARRAKRKERAVYGRGGNQTNANDGDGV